MSAKEPNYCCPPIPQEKGIGPPTYLYDNHCLGLKVPDGKKINKSALQPMYMKVRDRKRSRVGDNKTSLGNRNSERHPGQEADTAQWNRSQNNRQHNRSPLSSLWNLGASGCLGHLLSCPRCTRHYWPKTTSSPGICPGSSCLWASYCPALLCPYVGP